MPDIQPPYEAPEWPIAKLSAPLAASQTIKHAGDLSVETMSAWIEWMLVHWQNDHDLPWEEKPWHDYHAWISIGTALKLAFGDDGFERWLELTHSDFDMAEKKWDSFAEEYKPGHITLGTWFMRSAKLRCPIWVGRSAQAIFEAVTMSEGHNPMEQRGR